MIFPYFIVGYQRENRSQDYKTYLLNVLRGMNMLGKEFPGSYLRPPHTFCQICGRRHVGSASRVVDPDS